MNGNRQDSSNHREISNRKENIVCRVVASTSTTAHGMAVSFALCDEPAGWGKGAQNDGVDLWDAIRTSTGKIENSRIVVIGTKSHSEHHWYSRLLETDAATVFAADPDDDPFDPEVWRKANPSLGAVGFEALLPAIQEEAKEAPRRRILVGAIQTLPVECPASARIRTRSDERGTLD